MKEHDYTVLTYLAFYFVPDLSVHKNRQKHRAAFVIQLLTCKQKHILAYYVLGHLGDLAPLVFREVEAARHNLLPHVLWDGATVVLGVERRIAAQHHINNHTKRPQVTALEKDKKNVF